MCTYICMYVQTTWQEYLEEESVLNLAVLIALYLISSKNNFGLKKVWPSKVES